jgi:polysaccharide deacetylase family protein (PEP-CTERM system associated)
MGKTNKQKNQSLATASLSIDVEDWFHVQNLCDHVQRSNWSTQEYRVEKNMDRMLELLDQSNSKATCFILGWVADKSPKLVQRIASAGHEIASHGYNHKLVIENTKNDFREDVRRSKEKLEDVAQQAISGYRAPSFSITEWALDILAEEGYAYDSSYFPVKIHDRYGKLPSIPKGVSVHRFGSGIVEVTLSNLEIFNLEIPWAGGAWFRLYPFFLFKAGINRILQNGRPYVFYIHPWEIDQGQPYIKRLDWSKKVRHYTNLNKCEERFIKLLNSYNWQTIETLINLTTQRDKNQKLDLK